MTVMDLQYDVRKTDSLVSPYTGTAEFICLLEQSEFYGTKAEAEAASSFEKASGEKCQVVFAYQDGRWVVKSRRYYQSHFHEWLDASPSEPDTWPTLFLLMFKQSSVSALR